MKKLLETKHLFVCCFQALTKLRVFAVQTRLLSAQKSFCGCPWCISMLLTLSAPDPQWVVEAGGMRLQIKLRSVDLHSVAAARRLNDPAGAVAAENSETNRLATRHSTWWRLPEYIDALHCIQHDEHYKAVTQISEDDLMCWNISHIFGVFFKHGSNLETVLWADWGKNLCTLVVYARIICLKILCHHFNAKKRNYMYISSQQSVTTYHTALVITEIARQLVQHRYWLLCYVPGFEDYNTLLLV